MPTLLSSSHAMSEFARVTALFALTAVAEIVGCYLPWQILRQGASYVMRVRADNTAERVAVNLGPGRDNQVQIDGTLRAGDRVIIRGGERLEPGQTVKVQYL